MKLGDKIVILVAIVGLCVFLCLSAYKNKPGYYRALFNKSSTEFNPFESSTLKNPFGENEIKHLEFTFKQGALHKLDAKRQEAIKIRYLFTEPNDYVNAKLKYDNKTYRVTTRLKGDLTDHLLGNKWSFRVKLSGNNTIGQMKTFSLQHPKSRNNIMEWIYHKMMAQEGVVALRYDFVTVSVNGNYLGIFAMEEHFDKRLIEYNRRREGPILKFDETDLWKAAFLQDTEGAKYTDTDIYKKAIITTFKKTALSDNEVQYKYFQHAKGLLERFRKGELVTSQVFDIDLLASYCAVSEVLGAGHGKRWHNIRFYYNPVTSLLEPIAFDGIPGSGIANWNKNKGIFYTFHYDTMNQSFYSDPVFFRLFTKKIEKITSRKYSRDFFALHDPEIERITSLLKKEFSQLAFTKRRNVFSNQVYVKKVFRNYSDVVCFHTASSKDKVSVSCENIGRLPVEIKTISVNGKATGLQKSFRLKTKDHKLFNLANTTVPIPSDTQIASARITVYYEVLGASKETKTTSKLNKKRHDTISRNLTKKKSTLVSTRKESILNESANIWSSDCLAIDEATNTISFTNDTCHIKSDLIIPKGYNVVCSAGKKIYLYNNASIISYSPFHFEGTHDHPIMISSPDGTGNGLAIFQAPEPSSFSHVTFDNLSNPKKGNWLLTGAVTFYESDVTLEHCLFSNNRCEDGLNTIRNEFTIANSEFSNTMWDSFDSDFSNGSINNTKFRLCGNDCIDVSGTTVDIEKTSINRCGDKGISAGENSRVRVEDIHINRCLVGIAGKDLSEITANNVTISSTKIGLCGYQKKPEFGPAKIDTRNTTIEGSDLPWLIEKDSEIFLNGTGVRYLGKSKQKQIFKRLRNGQNLY